MYDSINFFKKEWLDKTGAKTKKASTMAGFSAFNKHVNFLTITCYKDF